ncbi:N-6 DNA methylase [Plantactinospora sp. B24E8]|uniref:N-6 DNA methylase n=1 Tax=Plantactinospora sp. B24E8 TaxID=3153567 RepID=UPI00325C5055
MPKSSALVTAAEISRLAGVTRATVSNWRRRHPDFPAPTGGTEASPAYDLAAVRSWLSGRGQLPTDSAADELRVALRAADDHGHQLPLRLLPLVLAVSRLPDDQVDALAELSDVRLGTRATELARSAADELPGTDDVPAFRADRADLLRALLTCVRRDGATVAAEVLADHDTEVTGASGGYHTPAPLAELMAALVAEPGSSYPLRVFDPACGAGSLLVAALGLGARELSGQDLVTVQAALAGVRLRVLDPSATSRLAAGDSLRADAFPQLTADAALCVPPYGDRDWGHAELAGDPRWLFGLPPRSESELAWAQHCLAHVKPGGPAVLLMPPATAERSAGRRLRAELLRKGALRAVVALPAGAATPLHVGLQLWLLCRPDPAESAPRTVLFVDPVEPASPPLARSASSVARATSSPLRAASSRSGSTSAGGGSTGGRSGIDWPSLRETVLDVWQRWRADPETFDGVPGIARAVPVIDLLDETVDLTPARHVRTAPAAAAPKELAETGSALLARLRATAAELTALTGGDGWSPAGEERQPWRSATVADLLRGNALTLLRAPATTRGLDDAATDPELTVQAGDVLLPELLRGGMSSGAGAGASAWVADDRDAGTPLGRHLILLRPDPERLDPWFLAGFLGADENVRSAATGSTIVRLDPRRLRVPLLPLVEQRRYGRAFQHLHDLRAAAELAGRLADESARTLGAGLTGGALLPPEPRDAS